MLNTYVSTETRFYDKNHAKILKMCKANMGVIWAHMTIFNHTFSTNIWIISVIDPWASVMSSRKVPHLGPVPLLDPPLCHETSHIYLINTLITTMCWIKLPKNPKTCKRFALKIVWNILHFYWWPWLNRLAGAIKTTCGNHARQVIAFPDNVP